jgi:hypothetical protein
MKEKQNQCLNMQPTKPNIGGKKTKVQSKKP